MHQKEEITTRLIINGFTINPIKDTYALKIFIDSLCSIYDNNHLCDLGTGIVHQNYLGKQIAEPSISYISNEKFRGLIRIYSFRKWLFYHKNMG